MDDRVLDSVRSKPQLSDPTLKPACGEWGDWTLPDRQLQFVAEGRLGPASWATLHSKAQQAIATCGLEVSTECTPRFDEKLPRGPGSVPGYGWIVGEGGLVVSAKSGLLEGPGYESFVATLQFWASPPLSKGTTDSPNLTHPWAVRVRAGQVRSVFVSRFSDRHFQKVLPTDAALAWIAPALVRGLQ